MQGTKAKLWGKYLGCMLGSALGDAIGELAFRCPEEGRLRAAIAAASVLRYTDDTATVSYTHLTLPTKRIV